MMIEKGFPPYAMHKGEHDRALEEMRRIFQEWQKTMDSSVLKIYLIEIVPLWLTNHIASMDTVTARFFDTGFSPSKVAH
jgi:hemerythrin